VCEYFILATFEVYHCIPNRIELLVSKEITKLKKYGEDHEHSLRIIFDDCGPWKPSWFVDSCSCYLIISDISMTFWERISSKNKDFAAALTCNHTHASVEDTSEKVFYTSYALPFDLNKLFVCYNKKSWLNSLPHVILEKCIELINIENNTKIDIKSVVSNKETFSYQRDIIQTVVSDVKPEHTGVFLNMNVGLGKTRTAFRIFLNHSQQLNLLKSKTPVTMQKKLKLVVLGPYNIGCDPNVEQKYKGRSSLICPTAIGCTSSNSTLKAKYEREFTEETGSELFKQKFAYSPVKDLFNLHKSKHKDTTLFEFLSTLDKKFKDKTQIVFFDYDLFRNNEELKKNPSEFWSEQESYWEEQQTNYDIYFILDEAHNMKSQSDGKQNKIFSISSIISDASVFRILLTASPLLEDVTDLHPLVSIACNASIKEVKEFFTLGNCDDRPNTIKIKDTYASVVWMMSKPETFPIEINYRYACRIQDSTWKMIVELLEDESLNKICRYFKEIKLREQELDTNWIDNWIKIKECDIHTKDVNSQQKLKVPTCEENATGKYKQVHEIFCIFQKAYNRWIHKYPSKDQSFKARFSDANIDVRQKIEILKEFHNNKKLWLSNSNKFYQMPEFINKQFYTRPKIMQFLVNTQKTHTIASTEYYDSDAETSDQYSDTESDIDIADPVDSSISNAFATLLSLIDNFTIKQEFPIAIHSEYVKDVLKPLYKILMIKTRSVAILTASDGKINNVNESRQEILRQFRLGYIDILLFGKIVAEGVDIISGCPFGKNMIEAKRNFEFHFDPSGNKLSYKRKGQNFWKQISHFDDTAKTNMISQGVNVLEFEKGVYFQNITNPVKHVCELSVKWHYEQRRQAFGRFSRATSHPKQFESDGNLDKTFPHGKLCFHTIINYPSINNTSEFEAPDEMIEKLVYAKNVLVSKAKSFLAFMHPICPESTPDDVVNIPYDLSERPPQETDHCSNRNSIRKSKQTSRSKKDPIQKATTDRNQQNLAERLLPI